MSLKESQTYKSVRIYPEDFEMVRQLAFFQNKKNIEVISEAITLYKNEHDLNQEIEIQLSIKQSEVKKYIEDIDFLLRSQVLKEDDNVINLDKNELHNKLRSMV
ncbi:UNVERIFIED_CONTAM: hypothetical protein N8J90_10620 [Halobacillus marinus]|uniref:hypothetical protein n=1 Tax=Halobacillus sp. KGW1 TaxID=1793726 RepID=UPI000781E48A|nr:hypothetical protein [Halobacillus sp. KGW1]